MPELLEMARHLDDALARLETQEVGGLVKIVLLGGTGVGKSALFNGLIEVPGASHVSDDRRCFTKVPHVACAEKMLPLFGARDVIHVDKDLGTLAIADLPDIDGAVAENHRAALEFLEFANVPIFVVSNEKIADFAVAKQVICWAQKKNWIFVLNKADRIDDQRRLREDFRQRLVEFGFTPSPESIFVVSAQKPEVGDLARLRAVLFGQRIAQLGPSLQRAEFLNYTNYAVRPEACQGIKRRVDELLGRETELTEKVRTAYRNGLNAKEVKDVFRRVVIEHAWAEITESLWPPLKLVAWMRYRFSMLFLAYRLSRLGGGVLTPLGAIGAAGAVLSAYVRGTVALQQILSALGPQFRRELKGIEDHAKRFLEDLELDDPGDDQNVEVPSEEGNVVEPQDQGYSVIDVLRRPNLLAQAIAGQVVHKSFDRASQAFQALVNPKCDASLIPLKADVERLAKDVAKRAATGWFQVAGNLVSWLFLGHVVYRLLVGYWNETYLQIEFFGNAFAIFLATLVPGYVVLSWRVNREAGRKPTDEIVDAIRDPRATRAIRIWRERLDEILKAVTELGCLATESLKSVELPSELVTAHRQSSLDISEPYFDRLSSASSSGDNRERRG